MQTSCSRRKYFLSKALVFCRVGEYTSRHTLHLKCMFTGTGMFPVSCDLFSFFVFLQFFVVCFVHLTIDTSISSGLKNSSGLSMEMTLLFTATVPRCWRPATNLGMKEVGSMFFYNTAEKQMNNTSYCHQLRKIKDAHTLNQVKS